jgi:Reductase C-terminal
MRPGTCVRRDRIVIVGASLAGLRAANAVRDQGHDGELTVIGDEPYPPYDRPVSQRRSAGTGPLEQRHRAGLRRRIDPLQPDAAVPFAPVPSFWSDLYGVQIRSVGLPQQADRCHVVEHDTDRRRLVLTATRRDRLVGAITVNRASRLAGYRQALRQRIEHQHDEQATAAARDR